MIFYFQLFGFTRKTAQGASILAALTLCESYFESTQDYQQDAVQMIKCGMSSVLVC
jgi:hypothetical protein